MIIGIDKGHSTWDKSPCGAVGLLNESKENRQVGDKVIQKLRALGHTVIDCSCNSASNVNEQLVAIVNKANAQKLDLFLMLVEELEQKYILLILVEQNKKLRN